jgi:putative colanic acid biosynthesis acetyltransferase WcaF
MTEPTGNKDVSQVDIANNRKARKWSRKELVGRLLWEVFGQTAFSLSPRPLWIFRRILLRLFGANIGSSVNIFPSVKIAVPWNLRIEDHAAIGQGAILYSLGRIHIGARSTVSQYAHLCAGSHDYKRVTFDLQKPPITIGSDAWICADAFIGPGVTVGDRTIIGARAVVSKSIPDGKIVAGNPAKVLRDRPELT